MCDFSGIYRRNLANIIARILFPGVLDLKRVPTGEMQPGIRRHFHIARSENGDAAFPCQHISRCTENKDNNDLNTTVKGGYTPQDPQLIICCCC